MLLFVSFYLRRRRWLICLLARLLGRGSPGAGRLGSLHTPASLGRRRRRGCRDRPVDVDRGRPLDNGDNFFNELRNKAERNVLRTKMKGLTFDSIFGWLLPTHWAQTSSSCLFPPLGWTAPCCLAVREAGWLDGWVNRCSCRFGSVASCCTVASTCAASSSGSKLLVTTSTSLPAPSVITTPCRLARSSSQKRSNCCASRPAGSDRSGKARRVCSSARIQLYQHSTCRLDRAQLKTTI